jgi:hypothetical protein
MGIGSKPAQCVDSGYGGAENTLSGNIKQGQDIMTQNAKSQQWSFGNRCGHVPFSPTIAEIPSYHKKRFPVLEQAKANMLFAYDNPMRFPIGRMFYNDESFNKDGSYRQRRSEIRESITYRIGQVILHSVNLLNMALGTVLPSGAFHAYGIEYIANIAKTTKKRVKRALALFSDFGYITLTERRYMTPNGLFRSYTPLISVHPSLFSDLEISLDDLAVHQKKQDAKAKHEQLIQKGKDAHQAKRASKKAGKKAMKQIKELLSQTKNGKSLTKDEKEYLDREMPGHERTNQPVGRYRDLTGCSKNKSATTAQDAPAPASNFFSQLAATIAAKLKIDDS